MPINIEYLPGLANKKGSNPADSCYNIGRGDPMEKGLVHLYYGDGKGKTTAAFGLALRACGRGKKILICQMFKSGDSGEILAIENHLKEIEMIREYPLNGFLGCMEEGKKEEELQKQKKKFEIFCGKVFDGNYDLALLDEACAAMSYGVISLGEIKELIRRKPERTELVLTGRNPKEELIALSDYASEIKNIKHPYSRGITAREGIEK